MSATPEALVVFMNTLHEEAELTGGPVGNALEMLIDLITPIWGKAFRLRDRKRQEYEDIETVKEQQREDDLAKRLWGK
jgi:hypothetical protein